MRMLVAIVLGSVLGSTHVDAAPKRLKLYLGHDEWEVTTNGAKHSRPAKYTHELATKDWSVKLQEWPRSSVFIQTRAEQLRAITKRLEPMGPVTILESAEVSKSEWIVMVKHGDTIHGVIMRPGDGGSNGVCTFELRGKATQHAPVARAVCLSLKPAHERPRSAARVRR